MESVIKQLVKAGHELSVQLGNQLGMNDTASLVQRLTAQLDITAAALREMTKDRDAEHADVLAWEKTMFKACGEDGYKSVAEKFAEMEAKCAALAAENVTLNDKMNRLATWPGIEFYSSAWEFNNGDGNAALEFMCDVQTPATDAYLAEVRAQGVTEYATKRGFSFQHGSIHAHFGNGDVMVGATKFENGHAGICFAPVREKEGGVGTEYKWTEGKNTEQVDSVFVISSSNIEGLEVIQGKLSEAITQLRQEAAQ